MSHARGKAEAAEGVAQKATEECRLARITAKELSPSFHIYGNGERTADAQLCQIVKGIQFDSVYLYCANSQQRKQSYL